ncbi:hypothetical protein JNUCC23_19015 [Peribacillus sp. JNUCC 23]
MTKPYLIAEILLRRGLPENVVKEITRLAENEIVWLKKKCSLDEVER